MLYWILKLNEKTYLTEDYGNSIYVSNAKVFKRFGRVEEIQSKYGGTIVKCTVNFEELES